MSVAAFAAQVLSALRSRLESSGMARNGLAALLVQIKGSPVTPHQRQLLINREIDRLVLQLRGAIQVSSGAEA